MARKEGTGTQARKRRVLNYFFLPVADHGLLLHKKLHISRGADTITAWCYPLKKRVAYTYTDVKKRMQPAYTTNEVAEMVGRDRITLERAILGGYIEEPQYTYGLDEKKNKYKYMWNEANIMELHSHLAATHIGRPRKDGRITSGKLPTARELRAIVRQEEILYVKTPDGQFVPTWRAEQF